MFHDSPSQAIALIERAIAADPQNPFARQTAAVFYLDIDDAAAAADVASATPVSLATATPALALHAGDWRTAGIAAQRDESFVFEGFEDFVAPYALRDMALRTHDYASAEDLLCQRYLHVARTDRSTVDLYNFRIWPLLAHLQLVQGNTARAKTGPGVGHRLDRCGRQIRPGIQPAHASPGADDARTSRRGAQASWRRHLPSTTTRAMVVCHRARPGLWNEVRETAEFRALAADARRFAARERAAVDELRRQGKIPRRPATQHPTVAAGP